MQELIFIIIISIFIGGMLRSDRDSRSEQMDRSLVYAFCDLYGVEKNWLKSKWRLRKECMSVITGVKY